MLQGTADADPALVQEAWVRAAVEDMHALTEDGRVPLVKNYGRRLAEPIPLEPVGEASRFLTYQWLRVRMSLGAALEDRFGQPGPCEHAEGIERAGRQALPGAT